MKDLKREDRGGGESRNKFLDPAANWRAIKEFLIVVPLGILVEGGLYVIVVGAAIAIWFMARGC